MINKQRLPCFDLSWENLVTCECKILVSVSDSCSELANEINPGMKSTGMKSTRELNQPRKKINPSTKSTKVGKKSTRKKCIFFKNISYFTTFFGTSRLSTTTF